MESTNLNIRTDKEVKIAAERIFEELGRLEGGTGSMRYEVRFTNQFKKDLKLAQKQGKDTDKLFEVIEKLANGEKLDAKYRDHDLTGNYKGCRECHVEPDWLLIYEVMGDVLVLMLYRVGSHSELFK